MKKNEKRYLVYSMALKNLIFKSEHKLRYRVYTISLYWKNLSGCYQVRQLYVKCFVSIEKQIGVYLKEIKMIYISMTLSLLKCLRLFTDLFSPFALCSAMRVNQNPTRWVSLMDGEKGKSLSSFPHILTICTF